MVLIVSMEKHLYLAGQTVKYMLMVLNYGFRVPNV